MMAQGTKDKDGAGYSCDFVRQPPLLFICEICKLVLRQPHITQCCGKNYGGWIVSKVQSLFWRRVTSLRRGVVSTGGDAFQLEDTTFCGGGVRFDLEEGV